MTQNNFAKIAIIGSVLMHIAIFAIIISATKNDEIATRFIVLGAHSKNTLHATYKSMPLPSTQKSSIGKSGAGVKSTPKKTIPKKLKKKQAPKPLPQKNKRTIPKKEKIPLKKMPTSIIEEKRTLKTPEKLRRQESDEPNDAIKKEKKKKKDTKKKEKSEEKKTNQILEKKLKKEQQEEEQLLADDELIQDSEDLETPTDIQSDNPNEIETIGINLSQLSKELTVYQECVQKEVLRLWSPPVGIPKGTECTLHFVISDTGKISHVDFIKRSKMLLYDLSIQQVAYRFDFDKRLWGKQFTIDFRQ